MARKFDFSVIILMILSIYVTTSVCSTSSQYYNPYEDGEMMEQEESTADLIARARKMESLIEEEMAEMMDDEMDDGIAVMQPGTPRGKSQFRGSRGQSRGGGGKRHHGGGGGGGHKKRHPASRSGPPRQRKGQLFQLNCRSYKRDKSKSHSDSNARAHIKQFLQDDNPGDNVACNDRDAVGHGLNLYDLMNMANSMLRYNGGALLNVREGKSTSYAYLPQQPDMVWHGSACGTGLFKSGEKRCSNKHGIVCEPNSQDSEMHLIEDCPTVSSYWSAWTPCLYCQLSLLKWNHKRDNPETTIHVATMYRAPIPDKLTPEDKPTDTACLALMMYHNFKFKIWNWVAFQDAAAITNPTCQNVVRLIQNCREFKQPLKRMEMILNSARRYYETSTYEDLEVWCPIPREHRHEIYMKRPVKYVKKVPLPAPEPGPEDKKPKPAPPPAPEPGPEDKKPKPPPPSDGGGGGGDKHPTMYYYNSLIDLIDQ